MGTPVEDKELSLPLFEHIPAEQKKMAVYVFMGLLVVYVIVRGVVGALWRPLWYDEFFTLSIANEPSLHDLWNAVKAGFDSHPPFFYLVERLALKLSSNTQVALRLPSILSFPCTLICVFIFAKRRCGEFLASLCALSLLVTILYHTYSIEARAYSMVIACMALALVCYQRLPSARWVPIFAFALILAELLHYYAVFAMIPFWLAEATVFLRTRHLRWGVWLALISGTLPLMVFLRLLMTIKANYGPHMFARPVLGSIKGYYATFFLLTENPVGMAIAIAAVAGIAWVYLLGNGGDAHGEDSVPDGILLLAVLGLPFIMYVLLTFSHGILLNRYALITILGVALGIVSAIFICGRRTAAIYALCVLCIVGANEVTFWHHPEYDSLTPYFSATSTSELQGMKDVIESAGHTNLPIVVSDCLLQSQFVYYFPRTLTDRMVYLVDEERELRYTTSDSSSRTQSAFSKFFPLRVVDYSQFTTAQGEFVLYSEGLDWYMPILIDEGFSVQLLGGKYGYGRVYLVKTKQTPVL